jgi:predicted O-methyltransferase YrrM
VHTPPADTLERLQAAGPPLQTDAWSLSDGAIRRVLAGIGAGARKVVECGSGRSTVIVARRLRELAEGNIHSLEHDPAWADATRAQLATEGLDRASVITAPLEPHPLTGGVGWYAAQAVRALPTEIDLLLIDGPPAGEPELRRSRHPALRELGPHLRAGATIILDDAIRPGERDAVAMWEAEYPLRFKLDARSGTATAQWQVYVDPFGGVSASHA